MDTQQDTEEPQEQDQNGTTAVKPWTRYSSEKQLQTLATLEEQGGNIAATSRIEGVPEATVRLWRNAQVKVPSADLVEHEKLKRAARWDRVVEMALDQVEEKLPDASAAQAAVIAGIATDKGLLLRGQATAITEHREDPRKARLAERYGQLRQVFPAPTHNADGTPIAPGGTAPAAPGQGEVPPTGEAPEASRDAENAPGGEANGQE